MARVFLQITDGTTTVDLVALGLDAYNPGSSIRMTGGAGTRQATVMGVERLLRQLSTIDEAISCNLHHVNSQTTYTTIRTIEFLLEEAAEWQDSRSGNRVYLLFSDYGTTVYRSEILKGNVAYDNAQFQINEAADITSFQIYIRRLSFWERNDEVQIPLRVTDGAATGTGALTITNRNDGTGKNWVEMDGSDIIGTMLAPVRIEFTNTTAANRDGIIYMGMATQGAPSSIPHILEGESATGASSQVSATSNGGNFGRFTTTTAFGRKGVWALTTTQATNLSGRYYRIIARFTTLPSANSYCYFSTHITGGTTEQTITQINTLSTVNYLQELGTLRLPPWMTGQSGLQAFDIGINLKSTGSNNVDLDYIALMPTDGFKVFNFVESGPQNTDVFIEDEILDYNYIQTSGGLNTSNVSPYGPGISVWPGKKSRLFFLVQSNVPSMDITRTHTVKLFYRPRRSTA
jgi:hypothetical protein